MLHTFLLVLQLGVQTQAPPLRDVSRPAPATASISGRVTDKESGEALPRAIVVARSAGSSTFVEAIADLDGRYEFTGLEAGEYLISAGPPELRATHLRQAFGDAEPTDWGAALRANLVLNAGELRAGVDIALPRALAIEGRVVDAWGEPMAGVEVQVLRINGRPTGPRTHSDDRGEFRLFGLAPGRYRVCAEPSSRFPDTALEDAARSVRTCHPGSVTELNAGDIVLTSRDATGIDIRVQRVGAYSLSGIVRDSAGNPAEAAFVAARSLDSRGVSAHTISSRGEFTVQGLIPGRYAITAAMNFSPMPRAGGPEPKMAFTQLDVSGDMSGLTLTMTKGRTITGRLIFDGKPVPPSKELRVVVQMQPAPGMSLMISGRPPYGAVDDELRFTLKDVFRIPLVVGVQGLPDGWAIEAVRYKGGEVTDMPTDFGSGDGTGTLDIVLTNRVATPVVRVTDNDGQRVTARTVVVLPTDAARWTRTPRVFWEPAEDGSMKLGALVPGEYLIAALRPDDAQLLMEETDLRISGLAAVATRVRLKEGTSEILDIRLVTLPPEIR